MSLENNNQGQLQFELPQNVAQGEYANFAIITRQQTALSSEAVTMIMVGLDVVAFFVGIVFGSLMHWFRQPIKYFAPLFFLLGYASYLVPSVAMILIGSAFIGIANGVGVPYLNTIASIKGGKNSATTVMPLLSAALRPSWSCPCRTACLEPTSLLPTR